MRQLMLAASLLASLPATSSAHSSFEPVRSSVEVRYENGASVRVDCERVEECTLLIAHHGEMTTIGPDGTHGLIVLPAQRSLIDADASGRSVVQVEIGCAEYADAPPGFICLAQLTIESGKVTHAGIFRRTRVDTYDAVPYRVDHDTRVEDSTLEELRRLRDVERRVSVTGCAIATEMQTIVVFDDCEAAAARDSGQGIDVSLEGFELDIPEGDACVALEGGYVAFGPETVNVGYFFGSHGHLIATAGKRVACPPSTLSGE